MEHCPVCGYENDENHIFCPICGSIIGKEEIVEPRRVFTLINKTKMGINIGAIITGLVMGCAAAIVLGWLLGLLYTGFTTGYNASLIGNILTGSFGFYVGYKLSIKQQKRDSIIKKYQAMEVD